ncbi:MAG: PepSY domain-containing protein [Sulfurimicrobium sp.]
MKRLALLCVLLLPLCATAGEYWRPSSSFRLAEAGRGQPRISMGDAMERVARATGGRVIQAQPATVNGHEGYRIKVLTARGEVRVVYVDGETGAMQ